MAVTENTITTQNFEIAAREQDFVSRFTQSWTALREILGVMRLVKKVPGYVIKSKSVEVTLTDVNVPEGDEVPLSNVTVTETPYETVDVEKRRTRVSLEAIKEYGYDTACEMTDNAFLMKLQKLVTNRFYNYLSSTEVAKNASTFQAALSQAKGYVINEFGKMQIDITGVVAFVNVNDLYYALGETPINLQTMHGIQYIKDFLGYNIIFVLSDEEIARGHIFATAVENMILYYIDPGDSDFARAGLVYAVDGETPLIGIHIEGNYGRASTETHAILGMRLFAEYQSAIANYTFTLPVSE